MVSKLEPMHTIVPADVHQFDTNRGGYIAVIEAVYYKLNPRGEIDFPNAQVDFLVSREIGYHKPNDPAKMLFSSLDQQYIKAWIAQHPPGKVYSLPVFAPGTTHIAVLPSLSRGGTFLSPYLVDTSGVLKGKTVTAIDGGEDRILMLCSDGTLAAWGPNQDAAGFVPVLVDTREAMKGKKVTAIGHYVLCSDGSLFTWGTGGSQKEFIPRLTLFDDDRLKGKKFVNVCGDWFFCTDGTMIMMIGKSPPASTTKACSKGKRLPQWVNIMGTLWHYVPTEHWPNCEAVPSPLVQPLVVPLQPKVPPPTFTLFAEPDPDDLLAGKTIERFYSSSGSAALVLYTDGTLVVWETPDAATSKPRILSGTGALEGKTVTGFFYPDLIVCSDGTIATWDGANPPTEVNVVPAGFLKGKKILSIDQGVVLFEEPDPAKDAVPATAKEPVTPTQNPQKDTVRGSATDGHSQ